MRIKGYEPDDICQSMGLQSFISDEVRTAGGPAIRLLLMPSFSPEVCVTTYPAADDAALDVRTFDALLWHERFTGHTPNRFATTARLLWTENERFAEQLYRCTQRPPRNRDGNYQTFDGMSAAALCCWKGTVHTIRDVSGTRSPAFQVFAGVSPGGARRVARRGVPDGRVACEATSMTLATAEGHSPRTSSVKMYILIRESVPLGFAVLGAAHASLACY